MKQFLALLIMIGVGFGQQPEHFLLKRTGQAKILSDGLLSNVISEIQLQGDSTVWLGTGRGLARVRDSLTVETLDTLVTTTDTTVLSLGISAIAISGDKMAFAAATSGDGVPVGAGIFYTAAAMDSVITWTAFDQPVDGESDSLAPFADRYFRALPVTTDHQNVTYDAAIAGGYIWITSWAGGLRRYNISEMSWDRVPLPQDDEEELSTCADSVYEAVGDKQVLKNFYLNPRDPGSYAGAGNHNHKGFSVLAYGDTVWVGTANGINRGILGQNGCVDWKHFSYPGDNITGNFVVGLARQNHNGVHRIWAACLNSDDPTEQRGLAWTDNEGITWNQALIGERIYNVTAADSIVLAASNRGLWKSEDGYTWALFKPAEDATPMQSDGILSNDVFDAALDLRGYYPDPLIWIGTRDGVARSTDLDGSGWHIYRAEYNPDAVYAYPNPFSPERHNTVGGMGYVRIHTDVKVSEVIELDVYNFAMEHVYGANFNRRLGDGVLKWNGRDANGNLVANGTYFIRLKYDIKTEWLKLIVVK